MITVTQMNTKSLTRPPERSTVPSV